MSIQEHPASAFYITGGTLPADATSYVEQAVDRDLLTSLIAGERIVLPAPVRTARTTLDRQ